MPGIFLALTILSALSFAAALSWVVLQWVRADRAEERAEREIEERRTRATRDAGSHAEAST